MLPCCSSSSLSLFPYLSQHLPQTNRSPRDLFFRAQDPRLELAGGISARDQRTSDAGVLDLPNTRSPSSHLPRASATVPHRRRHLQHPLGEPPSRLRRLHHGRRPFQVTTSGTVTGHWISIQRCSTLPARFKKSENLLSPRQLVL